MTEKQPDRRQLIVQPEPEVDPVVARYLWMITDTRKRTLEALFELDDETLNWTPPDRGHAIGTLLYHLALIEMDWLYVEILERPEYSTLVGNLLPYPDRNEANELTPVITETVECHLARLAVSHERLCNTLRDMTAAEFYRVRRLDAYDVTPEWVIHHLIQHEVEHRGEILEIRRCIKL